MAQIIDGKALAAVIRKEIAGQVAELHRAAGVHPNLAAILVGDDPASHIYVRNKIRACEEAGIRSESHYLAAEAHEDELLKVIGRLNDSPDVDGILLQLPLPPRMNKIRALDAILPVKDVDGLHPLNVGLLVQGRGSLIACTPLGVMEALKRYGIQLAGKNAVVIGRSDLVGKPLALLLMHENATVTICHSRTTDLRAVLRTADILIAAIGKPAFVTEDMVREGTVIIDVGINVLSSEEQVIRIFGEGERLQNFRNAKNVMVGDVHPAAYRKSAMYTPVPGGVGPLTIAMLLRNTWKAAQLRRSLPNSIST